jgi:hypothetical protein
VERVIAGMENIHQKKILVGKIWYFVRIFQIKSLRGEIIWVSRTVAAEVCFLGSDREKAERKERGDL